jgi:hypothetical protein
VRATKRQDAVVEAASKKITSARSHQKKKGRENEQSARGDGPTPRPVYSPTSQEKRVVASRWTVPSDARVSAAEQD